MGFYSYFIAKSLSLFNVTLTTYLQLNNLETKKVYIWLMVLVARVSKKPYAGILVRVFVLQHDREVKGEMALCRRDQVCGVALLYNSLFSRELIWPSEIQFIVQDSINAFMRVESHDLSAFFQD